MDDFVNLELKRNRGWPWPANSWGLTPMFGEDGWCRSCGTPLRPQCGSLIVQRKDMPNCAGAWTPNSQFDAICLEKSLAEQVVSAGFELELRDVAWHGQPPGDAAQIVIPTIGQQWFDSSELREATTAQHGTAGMACAECGIWRWMPLLFRVIRPKIIALPPLRIASELGDVAIAASPEWFGDGWNSFRQILVRRPLAELIIRASPRDFRVQTV